MHIYECVEPGSIKAYNKESESTNNNPRYVRIFTSSHSINLGWGYSSRTIHCLQSTTPSLSTTSPSTPTLSLWRYIRPSSTTSLRISKTSRSSRTVSYHMISAPAPETPPSYSSTQTIMISIVMRACRSFVETPEPGPT